MLERLQHLPEASCVLVRDAQRSVRKGLKRNTLSLKVKSLVSGRRLLGFKSLSGQRVLRLSNKAHIITVDSLEATNERML